jgi:hypothetical protein
MLWYRWLDVLLAQWVNSFLQSFNPLCEKPFLLVGSIPAVFESHFLTAQAIRLSVTNLISLVVKDQVCCTLLKGW